MPLELLLIGAALAYYTHRTQTPSGNIRLGILAGLLLLFQTIDWFGPKERVYSLAIPATMLAAYALLAATAAWAGANRTLASAAD